MAYLVEVKVSSKDDWDACGMGGPGITSMGTAGFSDSACKAFDLGEGDEEDLLSDKEVDLPVSIGLDFMSKEAWEEFKEVMDWVFSSMEEDS